MSASKHPKIILKPEFTDKPLDFILLLSLVVIAVVTIVGFVILPSEVPFKLLYRFTTPHCYGQYKCIRELLFQLFV